METMMQSAVCLLEQAAEKFKNKTVFEDKDGSISFEELREKSRIIGSELIKRVETGRKCPVIVYLPKSIKSIISFMGSLYSASPYVPIDYAIPMARMEKTVENLHPTAIITDTDGKTKLESLQKKYLYLMSLQTDKPMMRRLISRWELCAILTLRILCTHQAQQVCRKALQFQTEVL